MSFFDERGGGDIWSTGVFSFESPLKDLLDSGQYDLEDLLEQDELLQELRGFHPQLVDYLGTEASVAGLIRHLIQPTPPETAVSSLCNSHRLLATVMSDEEELAEARSALMPEPGTSNPDNEANEAENRAERGQGGTLADASAGASEEKGKWMFGKVDAPRGSGSAGEGERTEEEERELRYVRYPYMACEVICCEVPAILDIFLSGKVPSLEDEGDAFALRPASPKAEEGGNSAEADGEASCEKHEGRQSLLDLLFSMITSAHPLSIDDRRAGYLEKIITLLYRAGAKQMTAYLNENTSLLKDLISQCHSHCIGQTVQRLMLPPPPIREKTNMASSGEDDEDEGEGEGAALAFGGSGGWPMISGIDNGDNDGGGGALGENDDDDLLDDDDEEEIIAAHGPVGLIRSGWSENLSAVGWLLERLAGIPTGSTETNDEGDGLRPRESVDDALLDAAQNSSEILIAIVQNSPLTSPISRALASDPILGRIVDIICSASGEVDGETSSHFPPSESTVTLSMSVLESLVLQLGGYGAVPTPSEPDVVNIEEKAAGGGLELVLGTSTEPNNGLATTHQLINHLPRLLSSLSSLLRHPSTMSWNVKNQHSSGERPLLGTARLHIVRLLESLILLGNGKVDSLLCQSPVLERCLDLFWAFPWCSMLHQSVANLLVHVLEGGAERVDLQRYCLEKCELIKRLVDSFETNEQQPKTQEKEKLISTSSDTEPPSTAEVANQPRYSEVIFAFKESHISDQSTTGSVGAEAGSAVSEDDNDVLPVSEDDVEVAIEQQLQDARGLEVSNSKVDKGEGTPQGTSSGGTSDEMTAGTSSKTDDFRLGYMGHVIIVCQALVHACRADVANFEGGPSQEGLGGRELEDHQDGEEPFDAEIENVLSGINGKPSSTSEEDVAGDGDDNSQSQASKKRKDRSSSFNAKENAKGQFPDLDGDGDKNASAEKQGAGKAGDGLDASSNTSIEHPPIVALMKAHPLYDVWQSFITTTLASETAIQSTPLGGYASAQLQEMNGVEHRTSLTEEDLRKFMGSDQGEGGAGGSSAGISIDLDDTDLDIAASMMEALSLSHTGGNSESDHGSGQPGHQRHHQVMAGFGSVVQVAASHGYMYDDPLGGTSEFDEDDDSSDEEEGLGSGKEKSEDSGDEEGDAPVIDLFAGNLNGVASPACDGDGDGDEKDEGGGGGKDGGDQGGWANFDDAFASAGLPEPTPFAPGKDGSGQPAVTFSNANDDPFARSPHLVDALTDNGGGQ